MYHARKSSGVIPKKSLGQHFLSDAHVIQRIVDTIHPRPGLTYVEIGPGLGALTRHIVPKVDKLTAIEIDTSIIPSLQQTCLSLGKLEIIEADVLKVDFSQVAEGKKLQVFGNLPYNISTPILFHLVEHLESIDEMHFMLQEEVIDRIVAKPNSKDYGRLSVMIQTYCDVEKLFTIPPEAFDPPPKVFSAIVRLKPKPKAKQNKLNKENFAFFSHLVNVAFQQRRKTIRNSLKSLATEDQLTVAGLKLNVRAENISVEEFMHLAEILKKDKT